MSSVAGFTLEQFKTAVVDQGLEDQFLKITGLTSLDELSPDNFSSNFGKADSLAKKLIAPSASRQDAPPPKKESADASPAAEYQEASDFLYSFKHLTIRYPPKKRVSAFVPSAHVLYIILHLVNQILCDHFYFLRGAPNYHPAVLRIYFGVIFYVQTLRAMQAANILNSQTHFDFLKRFTDAYPPETLPVISPLLHVFKSLCASKPEIPQLGFVCPIIPNYIMPNELNKGKPSAWSYYLPDVPGILSALMMQYNKGTPTKSKNYVPEIKDSGFRGFKWDADASKWSADQAWSLMNPGIEYPFESGKKVNEAFFDERYDDLGLPSISSTTALNSIESYCGLSGSLAWFSHVRDVASVAAKYFPGSGSLKDCSPIGPPVNQVVSVLSAPSTLPTQPEGMNDDANYNLDLSYKLKTTSRGIDQLSIIMAGASQTNLRWYKTHPKFGNYGSIKWPESDPAYFMNHKQGSFFDIRPIESSELEEETFYGMADSIKKAIKDKV